MQTISLASPSSHSAGNLRLAKFALYFSPFPLTAISYEALRTVVQLRGTIHIGDLYALEERLFPIHSADGVQALSELVASKTHALLDVICGVIYLSFLVQFLTVSCYFFFRDRLRMLRASLGFLLSNLLGWVIWLAYPAAPPWYVDRYGTGPAVLDAVSDPAGLVRLDHLLGFPLATTFYAQSANVFGAMPSLHVTYATLIALLAWPLRGWLRIGCVSFAVTLAFSALYLRHHYLLDVLAGVILAFLVHALTGTVLRLLRVWRPQP
jgi:membrane-associated phospholipid phosphatase